VKPRRTKEVDRREVMTSYLPRDPAVFADNLNKLTTMHGLSRKDAAALVGASHLWYRRAVIYGVARVTKKNQPILEKIAEEFRITTVDDLWTPKLVQFQIPSMTVSPDQLSHVIWRQKEWWPYARKLAHILASGRHDYLRTMIDVLYRSVVNDGFKEPEAGAAYWSSGDD
jgi:hypothetical protein